MSPSGPVMECEALRKKAGGTRSGSNPESVAWEREFTGSKDPRVVVAAIKALRDKGNEVDLRALRGLIKAMGS